MVGVVFMVIVLVCAGAEAAEICPPKTCSCLGDVVDCTAKPLHSIPSNIPSWATELYISNNSIRMINATALKRLTDLKTLQLKKNKITSIHIDAFVHNVNLTELDLSRNAIKIIEPLTFKTLEKLKNLNARHNNISVLKDGTFYGLKHIKTLALDSNYIQSIQKSWLYGLDSLERLLLSSNKISIIEQTAWECVPRLKELNLASNRLVSIKRSTFLKLGSLEKLNLNNNNISFLDNGAFSNTPKLKTLHLSNNFIHVTIENNAIGVFRGLLNLEKFYLASNNIKTIKKNSFAGLHKITHLDLNHNNITSIQKNAFAEMPSLRILKLSSTAMVCDCNVQWFYNFLRADEKFKSHSHLVCAYPESLNKMPFLNVPADNFTCDNFVKPRLVEQPDAEIMALKGENVTLSCKAISSASDPLIFQWKKDGKDIYKGNITNVPNTLNGKSTESVSTLTLFGVQQVDSGKYQCIVTNSFGTEYSQKCSISVLIYPQFIKMPRNVTVQSGTSVQLECAATGEPKPEIAWQKDGGINFPAAKDRRMQVKSDDEDVFFLLNVKREDMGVYSCIAHNPAGTIVANASVVVEEVPYFSKMMENREVTIGGSVVLNCMAGGTPKPSIQWLKNGAPIHTTERHFFTAEDQLMIIIDAVLKDAGTYQCVLNNSLGVSNASSVLVVKPGATYDKAELINNKMGVIIITVVCCAVVTSIVWVVIIFQARKRMRSNSDSSAIQDNMIMEFTEKETNFADNISEHSSCKDSGTGDSAKRSNDDLVPDSEYTLIINNVNSVDAPKSMRSASLVYVPSEVNTSITPLLHTDCPTFPRSTNHDRRLNNPTEEVIVIEKCPQESSE